jgi:hypothetical protein
MVIPKTLAVLRLMTSSNVVGCSTDRSAAFTPFSICFRPLHRGQPVCRGEIHRPSAQTSEQQRVLLHEERIRTLAGHRRKGAVQLVLMAQLHDVQLHPQLLCCRGQVLHPRRMIGGRRIHQCGDACALGHHLPEKRQALPGEFRAQVAQAGNIPSRPRLGSTPK